MTPTQAHLRQDRAALEAELRQAGATIRGNTVTCPFHEDRHASGSIYQGQDGAWRFKCNAATCGVGGDVFDMRARISGRPLADVLKDAGPDAAKSKRQRRGGLFETLGDLRLAVARIGPIEAEYSEGYADPDTGKLGLLVFRLGTPNGKRFIQAHEAIGGYSMTAPDKPWAIYNRAGIRAASDILVVEGEKCADAVNGIGLVATTAPGGAGKAKHADWSPLAGKRVWLWPDADEAGRKHMQDVTEILRRLDPAPALCGIDPVGLDLAAKEDAHDFIAQCGVAGIDARQAILDAMSRAKRLDPLTFYRDRQEKIRRGELRCVPLPWRELHRLTLAMQPGRVTILAGSKGAAKSFMLLECIRFWLAAGETVATYIMEGSIEEYLDRALAQITGNPDITNIEWQAAHADEMRALTDAHSECLSRLSAIVTRSPLGATLGEVAGWIDAEAPHHRILCIDPVTMAMRTREPWIDDKAFIDHCKHTAESRGCSIVLVSHLQKGAAPGDVDRLAGGAAYERFSDTIIQVARHDVKTSIVSTALGRIEVEHNQTAFIEKARAPGTGYRLAYNFAAGKHPGDSGPLSFTELGIIARKESRRAQSR